MAVSRPASRIEVFDVTIPVLRDQSAPLEVLTTFNPGELVGLEAVIPDGHSGLTGFRVMLAHAPVIPATAGAWISGNDERLEWDLIGYPNSGAWSVLGYNTDQVPHTFHFRFLVSDFPYIQQGAAPVALAPTPVAV